MAHSNHMGPGEQPCPSARAPAHLTPANRYRKREHRPEPPRSRNASSRHPRNINNSISPDEPCARTVHKLMLDSQNMSDNELRSATHSSRNRLFETRWV